MNTVTSWPNTRRRTNERAVAAAFACAVFMGACTLAPNPGEHAVGPDLLRAAAERTWPSPETMETLRLLEDRLVQRCMEDRGFEYPLEPDAVDIERRWAELGHRRNFTPWGWDDPDLARRIGYGIETTRNATERLVQEANQARANSPQARVYASLSPQERVRYDEALTGSGPPVVYANVDGAAFSTRPDGCLAQAQSTLYGSLTGFAHAIWIRNELSATVEHRMTQQADYRTALEGWRRCMERHGYDVDDPLDAYGYAYSQTRELPTSDERARVENAVAVADAECNREADLSTIGDNTYGRVLGELAGGDLVNVIRSGMAALHAAVEYAETQCRTLPDCDDS